jgi:hypothetical protein
MRRQHVLPLIAAATLVVLAGGTGGGDAAARGDSTQCPRPSLEARYVDRVSRALRAKRDVWGNALISAAGGPTYAGARRSLSPLLLARGPKGKLLTDSGVHYVPFSGQVDAGGSSSMALHVADGSQIVSQRAAGRSLTIAVGGRGRERYGSCLARLSTPRLASGYLPIVETRYVDADGVRYRQESFAARISGTRSLVSFVELAADAESSAVGASVRFTPSESGLVAEGNRLVRRERSHLVFGSGATLEGGSVVYDVPAGESRTLYVAWLNSPSSIESTRLDRETYESARASLSSYWENRLREGLRIDVPEKHVLDAERSLLIQNLGLTWRYSIGNPYQQFSYPEGVDVAQVMATNGFADIARAILLKSLGQKPTRYPNWKMGQKLVGSALYFRLYRDRAYVDDATPVLRAYVDELQRQSRAGRRGLLQRERYSSDIPDSVYGLHTHAVVWQGLRSMADVWEESGRAELAARCRRLAAKLAAGIRLAVRSSERKLDDGSLFLDVRLLDRVEPYGAVTASRYGSYWNLVMPYALASGLFPPRSREADGIYRYMQRHGSRMLGLVRAGVFSLYGLKPAYPRTGVNPVYGLNVARFLADNDEPDQLVLSLYGQLGIAMAPGTFVAGEGVSVAPLGNEYYRSMYLPPNAASNGSFLETLRLLLVHETRDRNGAPRGLQLGFATPRAWLEPGKRIAVRRAPTSFGQLSFSIEAREDSFQVTVDVPRRSRPRRLDLRLRLPGARRIDEVLVDGRAFEEFDARSGTIFLPTRGGRLDVTVRVSER